MNHKTYFKVRTANREAGLSLIEVMIALVVLSIGLTGMAALHLNSLKNAHSSYYRSIASTMALDFEERLWMQVADFDVDGCPNPEGVRETLAEEWNTEYSELAGARRTRIPNVNSQILDTRDGANDQWREVDLRLTWAESRLVGEQDGEGEQFDYTVRVLCRRSA